VQIVCDHCKSRYEVDVPSAPFGRDQDLMFRCSACQRSFAIRFDAPTPTEEPLAALQASATPEASEQSGFLLRQEGKVYHVHDLAMLQRWVAERRVLIGDEISTGDGRWSPVASMDELRVFFDLVAAADGAGTDAGDVSLEPTELAVPSAALSALEPPQPIELSMPTPTFVDEAEIALEGIPDEEPRLPAQESQALGPDDPTMDLVEPPGGFFGEGLIGDAALFDAQTEEHRFDEDADFEWVKNRKRTNTIRLSALFIIGLIASFYGMKWLESRDMPVKKVKQTEVVEVPEEVAPEAPAVVPSPADPPAAAAEEATAPPEPPTPPEPAAVPETTAPPEPPPVNAGNELSAGWAAVDRERWSSARRHFQAVLSTSPGSSDALLGLAYVAEHQGNVDAAVTMYCRLTTTSSGSTRTEAEGRLRALRRTCS
jgi:hypothetical protein